MGGDAGACDVGCAFWTGACAAPLEDAGSTARNIAQPKNNAKRVKSRTVKRIAETARIAGAYICSDGPHVEEMRSVSFSTNEKTSLP